MKQFCDLKEKVVFSDECLSCGRRCPHFKKLLPIEAQKKFWEWWFANPWDEIADKYGVGWVGQFEVSKMSKKHWKGVKEMYAESDQYRKDEWKGATREQYQKMIKEELQEGIK